MKMNDPDDDDYIFDMLDGSPSDEDILDAFDYG